MYAPKITIYKVEVGVLLPKSNKEYKDYSNVYDKQHAFYDENTAFFLNSSDASEYAFAYVIKGNVNTYAIIKGMVCEENSICEEDLLDIRAHGIFEGWQDFFEEENWDTNNIVLDIYKSADKTITFDFIDKTLEKIKAEVISKFTKASLIEKCVRDEENPMGVLLTYIKDTYGMTKPQAWNIAAEVLDELQVENRMYCYDNL